MADRAEPFVLESGASRIATPFVANFMLCAPDTAGLLSVGEFTLGGWESGPVLHLHKATDEAFYIVSGTLEIQVDDRRLQASTGGFAWVPRGTAHTFANGGEEPVHAITLAMPGGLEDMLVEHAKHIAAMQGRPDEAVMDEIGRRHGAITLGPPIRAANAPVVQSP